MTKPPDRLPGRPPEPTMPAHLHPTTRVPRVFGIWGTACYGIGAIASITSLLVMGFTGWTPPWWFLMPVFLYTFISAGIICFGRIESNRDAKFFMQALRDRSAENKRMRKMN